MQESALLTEAEVARMPESRAAGAKAVAYRVPLDSSYLFERAADGSYRGPPGLPARAGTAADVVLQPYDNVLIFRQTEWSLPQTVVITGDILLADRCLKKGASVIGHNGKPFTTASIGGAIATRAIMADLRVAADGITGGPAPFAKADRSRFLQALDQALVRLG